MPITIAAKHPQITQKGSKINHFSMAKILFVEIDEMSGKIGLFVLSTIIISFDTKRLRD